MVFISLLKFSVLLFFPSSNIFIDILKSDNGNTLSLCVSLSVVSVEYCSGCPSSLCAYLFFYCVPDVFSKLFWEGIC